jgi:bile acid-coenzyme A ligase
MTKAPPASKPYVRMLRELAEQRPHAAAVTCQDQTLTRAELESRSNRLARAYAARGVGYGDFVTIALPNSIEFLAATIACWKIGAIPQPVSRRLPAVERQAIVELADSRLVHGGDPDEHQGRTVLPPGFEPDDGSSDAPLPEVVSPAARATASSGSTGRPKLIVAGTPAEAPANLGTSLLHMAPEDVQLVPGPMYHNTPLAYATHGLFLGQHVVVLPRFDAAIALEAIQRFRVSWVSLVPTMMARMLRVIDAAPDRFDLSSLRIVWHMAAPCADWLKHAWIELVGPEKLFELYGGTESVALTAISGTEWLSHRGSVGRPILGEMIVLDAAGVPAPPGQVGEIFMRRPAGAAPTYRYLGAESKEKAGWDTLGDLGWMDEDGFLYVSDRRTDLILSGGENVYPAEVEAAIDAHPRVLSSVVVGMPDDDLGQRVHAVVQPADDAVESADIVAHVAERLVRYKVPRSVEFTDEPLRDDAGKVRRGAVRDAAIARLGQHR